MEPLTQREVLEMHLASHLHMTVYEMKSKITSEEFDKWQQYFDLHPIHATDLQLTKLTMLAAAFAGQKNIEFADFYLHKTVEQPKHKQEEVSNDGTNVDELQNYIFANYGGKK